VRPLGSYVMENVLFKVSYPAEFHAQTAVEAAISLHPVVRNRLDEISEILIETQEPAVRIIDKTGPLHNPADRDHCLQYMIAVPLAFGRLVASDYDAHVAADPRIEQLRSKMVVREHPEFTRDYYDPEKRFIGNAIRIAFNDGTRTEPVRVDYPIGHRLRRNEAVPLIEAKFKDSVAPKLSPAKFANLSECSGNLQQLEATPVSEWMSLASRTSGAT
jgi:2-methylcitrate dehydratase